MVLRLFGLLCEVLGETGGEALRREVSYQQERDRALGRSRPLGGSCFMNAYLVDEGRGLVYVEGFAVRPPVLSFLVHHA